MILHHISATVHILADLVVDAALSQYPDVDLLGTFTDTNAYVEPLRFLKVICLPVPFFGLFLEWGIMHT